MEMTSGIIVESIATLVGIFAGTLAALIIDRRNERRRLQSRTRTVLRSLASELDANFKTLQKVKPAYASTPWGKSFYISTVSWETALAGGDLPHIIGFELTDSVAAHYALLMRIRYYVDLLTQLWFAPGDVSGYDEMRRGFIRTLRETMSQVMSGHRGVMGKIQKTMQESFV